MEGEYRVSGELSGKTTLFGVALSCEICVILGVVIERMEVCVLEGDELTKWLSESGVERRCGSRADVVVVVVGCIV